MLQYSGDGKARGNRDGSDFYKRMDLLDCR